MRWLRLGLSGGLCALAGLVTASSPANRWGHTASLITSSSPLLVIQGGRSDPTSAFSYNSAHIVQDLITLDLSADFPTTSPPWTSIPYAPVGSAGSNTAWGVASVFGERISLFGGMGGAELAIQTRNDSLWTLDLSSAIDRNGTALYIYPDVNQPMRRMYASAATASARSTAFITGGEKADGSGLGFREAYRFDGKAFEQLPNMPTELCHHASVVTANGTLVVIGGYISSSLEFLAMTTIYVLDAASASAVWRTITVAAPAGRGPAARRGHTATYMPDQDAIFVYGGIAESLSGPLLDDVWVLDLRTSSWKEQTASETPAGRYDHTATLCGNSILFFGGYASSGPADAALHVFDTETMAFVTSYSVKGTAGGYVPQTGSVGSPPAQSTLITSIASAAFTTTDAAGQTVTFASGDTITVAHSLSSLGPSTTFSPVAGSPGGSGNQRAIAIGSTAAALVVLILAGALIFAWRKRRERRRRQFTPFGGYFQPERRPSKPYRSYGDGSEKLIAGGPLSSRSEKYTLPPVPEDEEEEDLGTTALMPATPSPKRRLTRTFLRDAPAERRAPQISEVVPSRTRRDMLADEDEDAASWVDIGRSRSIRPVVGDLQDDSSEMRQIQADLDAVDEVMGLSRPDVDTASSRGSGTSSGADTRGVCASDDFGLDAVYGQTIMAFVEGRIDSASASSHSSSRLLPTTRNISGETSHSKTDSAASQPEASVLVARKTSLDSSPAAYVPVPRRDSLLRRLAGDRLTSIFAKPNDTDSSKPHYLELRDPAPPPRLHPLEEDNAQLQADHTQAGPSAYNGHLLDNAGQGMRSMSSILTNASANSALLARYGLMDIGQRQRDASSTTDYSAPGSEANSVEASPLEEAGSSAAGRVSEDTVRHPNPISPIILRPSTRPTGPRPPSPVKRIALGVPDRSVRDIAASINKRSATLDNAELHAPNLVAIDASLRDAPPMISPSRGIRPPQGPRPKTVYLMQERQSLSIANE